MSEADPDSLKGGTVEENAAQACDILAGTKGPQRDVVLMNAAAALLAGDKVATLQQGIVLAGEIIDNGHAMAKLEQLINLSQSFA